ncbi:MAG: hypothetical protein ABH860_00330 [bacterium]
MEYNEIERILKSMPNKKAPEGIWERIEGTIAAKEEKNRIFNIFTPSPRLVLAVASLLLIITVSSIGIKVHRDNIHSDVNQYLHEMAYYINSDTSWIDLGGEL